MTHMGVMVAKAKKRQRIPDDTLHGPTPERWKRGEVELVQAKAGQSAPLTDADGRPSQPFRVIDILVTMERRGTITKEMQRAGEMFRDTFALAALEPMRAADLSRLSGTAGPKDATVAQYAAREVLWEAIKTLGGIASPAGCCAWHILGMGASVRDWATREGWRGRPIGENAAAGILIGALGTLAAHFGLVSRNQ